MLQIMLKMNRAYKQFKENAEVKQIKLNNRFFKNNILINV